MQGVLLAHLQVDAGDAQIEPGKGAKLIRFGQAGHLTLPVCKQG